MSKTFWQRPFDVFVTFGCLTLLVATIVAIVMGLWRDWRIIAGLVAFLVVLIGVFWGVIKKENAKTAKASQELLEKLGPGVYFRAHGSMGTPMRGRCIRVIDNYTIEASVGYADQSSRETGPFPISNIDSIED
jgi:hypothetical protein